MDSGAKVTVKDSNGKVYKTDEPTTTTNSVQLGGQSLGTYEVTMDATEHPYDVEISMPGHFKGYTKTPVIGSDEFGYQSGGWYDIPSRETPSLAGGDVNGDNVIDMKDAVAEITAYLNYKNLISFNNPVPANLAAKTTFLNNNRSADVFWKKPGTFGYGLDYYDFYYIFKNFGKQNQSAIDAGLTVPTPQLTVDQATTISTPYGGSINLAAGDGLKQVIAALNFAGPAQKYSNTTLPTFEELKNGSTITLINTDSFLLDDEVWRKAITEIDLTNPATQTSKILDIATEGNSNNKVAISQGGIFFDPIKGPQFIPSKLTLQGLNFPTTGTYKVTIQAAGYKDVTYSFTVTAVPIPTPAIGIVIDPTKAHIGQDLTFTFPEDANWRNGITKIMVRQANTGVGTVEVPSAYYDITQSGKIIFNKDVFKTNSPVATAIDINSAPVVPGGAKNYLPQQYQFVISSRGADGTVYPDVIAGKYNGDTNSSPTVAQSVGYGVTFDSQGGSLVNPIAVGYNPSRTKVGTNSSDFAIATNTPAPTRAGYKFLGWYNEPTGLTQWSASGMLTADKTVYAKWQIDYVQNISPVDKTKPDGLKFDGLNGRAKGFVLGEGNLNIQIPDTAANVPWLSNKDQIAKIEATYTKLNIDGTGQQTPTTYTLDPSTYGLLANSDGSGTLSFTTATESYATAHPTEKFAFSEAPYFLGYTVTVTSTNGQTITIPNVKLSYRSHIDLNGGALKNPSDTALNDQLINGRLYGFNMDTIATKITNGKLTIMPSLYLDSAGTSGKASPITQQVYTTLKDNSTMYIIWVKTPPTVSNDKVGNIVGSDITLPFTDDGVWRNNIKKVSIGSKELVQGSEYKINYDATTKKGSFVLDKSLFTTGQKVNVVISSEGYKDAAVLDQVVGHTVTFESNGGDAIAPQIVATRVSKPVDPIKVGYTLMGWYTDAELTNEYDFVSIITKPITLYAKYALATSIVLNDTLDNCLGNDMTLEFTDSDWAKAITSIKIGGNTVDQTKYTVDATTGKITLDKSLFTKTGDFNIVISAKEYADVSVSQKVINGYKVQFKVNDAPFEVKDQIVARRISQPEVYGYDLTWFADEARTIPWDFTNSIYSARTLYGKWSLHKFTVIFDRQDGGLVENRTADYNTTITAPTPTRTGYAFLGWYKDAAGKTAWNFAKDKVTDNVILYAKWVNGVENNGLYNKNVTITFNEATAKLDGKEFKSETTVTDEGNHTLVVTDASGNATTVKFTIDRTAPTAPKVDKVTSTTTKCTGTAEAGSTIIVKAGTKSLGTGTVDSNGKFAVSIVKQNVSIHLYVTAIDKAGNESSATKVTVSK